MTGREGEMEDKLWNDERIYIINKTCDSKLHPSSFKDQKIFFPLCSTN
jgi:hypothetical protein